MTNTKMTKQDHRFDPTAYELARGEGKSFADFVKMTLTLLVVIPAFVYVAQAVAEPFMANHFTGMIATGGILFALYKFFQLCDRNLS